MDSLPTDEDTADSSVDLSSTRAAATARAVPHAPNRRVTTLAAGHSASARCATASPPRQRACVRDQSYDVGSRPKASLPVAHRFEHALPGPPPLDRARMAALTVGVGVALAVPRLERLPERFGGRRFAPLDTPEWLDYEGVELVLIGAAELRSMRPLEAPG
jgi:hypothetical protein